MLPPPLATPDTSTASPGGYAAEPSAEFSDLSHVLRGQFDPGLLHGPEDVTMMHLNLSGYTVRDVRIRFRAESLTRGDAADAGHFCSCLLLKGRTKLILPDKREVASDHDGLQNFKFDPNTEFMHWCPPNTAMRAVTVTMDATKLAQILPDDEHWSDELKTRIAKRQSLIGGRCAPLQAFQLDALQMILNCPLKGKLGLLTMESAVTQILAIQMDSFFGNRHTDRIRLPKRDEGIVEEIRNHLTGTFLQEQSIAGLARSFGINQSKLMKLFRTRYGMTVFDYVTRLRMDHAKLLLQKEGLTVSEVSSIIGYKNSQHFSAAFKRRFGINPSVYK